MKLERRRRPGGYECVKLAPSRFHSRRGFILALSQIVELCVIFQRESRTGV